MPPSFQLNSKKKLLFRLAEPEVAKQKCYALHDLIPFA